MDAGEAAAVPSTLVVLPSNRWTVLLIENRGSQPWPDNCLGRGRVLLCGFLCSPCRMFNSNAGLCPLDASTSSPSSNNQNCLTHNHMSLGWGA